MKKYYNYVTLLLVMICAITTNAQDFSNKGKDFWVGYGYHERMIAANGGIQDMVLYFATDQVTNINISIPGTGYTQTLTSTAGNNVLTSATIPKTGAQDARLQTEGLSNKGIHITSDKPMVVYAHVYNASVSGATILFPTNTLGREYYSINYKNTSNTNNANSFFYVIAADTGTTRVEITPSANTTGGWLAGTKYTINLTQGQVYNVMGVLTSNSNPFTGVDLTGSIINSVSSASGSCKRIAVFSGSGRISISCNTNSSSSDNYMVQAFPRSAWGKKFLTVPAAGNQSFNIYRVCVSDPSTIVKINGVVTNLPLQNNFYYEISQTNQPQKIEADKPITVAQYFTSQGQCGNGNPGDPEVIYLSPVEQNIEKVLWNATPNFLILTHYFNVIIPNSGTAVSSFRLDGMVPNGTFLPHPQDSSFVYLSLQVSAGPHIVQSDSGFNAIAYGFGNAESYGYNAGTNIRDLYQFVSIQNKEAIVNYPATCKGSPFKFSLTFPYQPLELSWKFNGLFNDTTIIKPVYDSTWQLNGRNLYRYSLPSNYVVSKTGLSPIKVLVKNPTSDGCSGEQEIDFDIEVFEPPKADFSFINNGCLSDSVKFTNTSNNNGRGTIKWFWDFDDGTSSLFPSPTKLFTAPKAYNVKFSMINDIGCLSDTAMKIVTLFDPPVAKFLIQSPLCIGKIITFKDSSYTPPGSTLVKWTWNFGDNSPVIVSNNNASQNHVYTTTGNYEVSLIVESATGCKSLIYKQTVTISNFPKADFGIPNICLPSGTANFNNLSTITGGTITYLWDFGNSTSSILKDPVATYATIGPFNVKLTATSNNGCIHDTTKIVNTVFAEPIANFTAPAEVCLGDSAVFTNLSNAPNSTIVEWNWDFGNGTLSTLQNPPAKTYTSAGTYTVTLRVKSTVGCFSPVFSKNVVVNPLPTPQFSIGTISCEKQQVNFINSSVPNVGTITTWNWNFKDGDQKTYFSGNPFTKVYDTAGNYDVLLEVITDKGCKNSVTQNVRVNTLPRPNFILPNVCLPAGTAQFMNNTKISSGSISSYAWDFGNSTSTGNVLNPVATYTALGTYSVKLTATSDKGCIHDTTKVLNTIYAEPQAKFTATAEVCLGDSAVFINQSSAPSSIIVEWNWDFGDGTLSTLQNPPAKTYLSSGTYSVTLRVKSAIGCFSPVFSKNVVVNPLPTPQFSIGTLSCEKQQVNFINSSVANAGNITTWNWNFKDADLKTYNTGNSFTKVYDTAGNYDVLLEVITDKGCKNSVTKNVRVNTLPRSNFVSPKVCLDDAFAFFTNTTTIADGTAASLSYSWNFGDINSTPANNISTDKDPSHKYSQLGVYTASLKVTSINGCVKDTVRSFTVNGSTPKASFNVLNDLGLCSNTLAQIQNTSTVAFGSITDVKIKWDLVGAPRIDSIDAVPTSNKIYSTKYPDFQNPLTKNYSVRLYSYSGSSCVDSAFKVLTINASPRVIMQTIPGICNETSPRLISQGSEVGGVPGTFIYRGTNITPAGMFDPKSLAPNNYDIEYVFTSDKGCRDSITKPITVWPSPVAYWSYSGLNCEKNAITFTDSSVANYSNIINWKWDFGTNGPAPVNLTTGNPFDKTFATYAGYNVGLQVFTDSGCQSIVNTKLLTIHPLPRVNFKIPEICLPAGRGQFLDQSSIPVGTASAFKFNWNFGDGGSNSVLKDPFYTFSNVGPYNIKLIVTSEFNCVDSTVIKDTTIYPQPKADFSVDKLEACLGSTFSFRDLSNGKTSPLNTWKWNLGDNNTSTIPNPINKYVTDGSYIVSLFVYNQQGCVSDTIRKTIVVHPYPTVNAGKDLFVLEGGQLTLNPIATGNNLKFKWTPPLYLDSDTIKNPITKPLDDITYIITVTGTGNCSVNDDVFIKVLLAPEMPNVFSPNGDGINDFWEIKYLESYPGTTVEIYNRYGQLIFRSIGYNKPWDGTFKGKQVPAGTYYYIVNPKNGRKQIAGFVDVIR